MNLLTDSWIPVMDKNGALRSVSVRDIACSSDLRSLAAPRDDFRVSLAIFLSGLLALMHPCTNPREWYLTLKNGLDEDRITSSIEQMKDFFQFALTRDEAQGRPQFMEYQFTDEKKAAGTTSAIGQMLFGYPGQITVEKKQDIFIKNGSIRGLCPACAAQAVINLQRFAGQSGQGYRPSITGTSGMLTLVLFRDSQVPLWKNLWLNVWPQENPDRESRFFYWGRYKDPNEVSYAQLRSDDPRVLFIVPQRAKLNITEQRGCCSLCGRDTERLITEYEKSNKLDPHNPQGFPYAVILQKTSKDGEHEYKVKQIDEIYSGFDWITSLRGSFTQSNSLIRPLNVQNIQSSGKKELNNAKLQLLCSAFIHGISSGNNKYFPDIWYQTKIDYPQFDNSKQSDAYIRINDSAVNYIRNAAKIMLCYIRKIKTADKKRGDPDKIKRQSDKAKAAKWNKQSLTYADVLQLYSHIDGYYRSMLEKCSQLLESSNEETLEKLNQLLTDFCRRVRYLAAAEFQQECPIEGASSLNDYFKYYLEFREQIAKLPFQTLEEI